MNTFTKIVIIGGGIAGVSCLDALLTEHSSINLNHTSITLISENRVIKKVVNYTKRGRNLESFDIETGEVDNIYSAKLPRGLDFRYVVGNVVSIDGKNHLVHILRSSDSAGNHGSEFSLSYDLLCLATGSSPRQIETAKVTDREIYKRILTVRDTTSVQELKRRLTNVNKVAILGNGGISLELVHNLTNCDIFWLIRDEFIGHPFLDSGASKFLLESSPKDCPLDESIYRNLNGYNLSEGTILGSATGPALGPHWLDGMTLVGARNESGKLVVLYKAEVDKVSFSSSKKNELLIILRDSRIIEVDLIILAMGVVPNVPQFSSDGPEVSQNDGGILVDTEMRTSISGIYAAGDVVSCEEWPQDTLWFQMRLWTQARQLGYYCAKCISAHLSGDNPTIFANFDSFTHVTSFFGFKIVLLGRYNAQYRSVNDDQKLEVIARINRGKDYIKLVLRDDRVIGAILVGETNLEETIENLIHDQINIHGIKHQLLDDTVDIEDYFD